VPNCTIITTLMAVAPLHREAGLRSLSVSSYQAVSGAGHRGVTELVEQVGKLHGAEDDLGHPDVGALPVGEVFGKTIAYNVVAKIDVFDRDRSFRIRAGEGRSPRCRVVGDLRPVRSRRSQREPSRDVPAAVVRDRGT
jgi:aspartate-semialdehyde dehydrogenase